MTSDRERDRSAPAHLRALWAERMKGLFDPHDAATVLEWLTLNWQRPRVVVVGSGFTRNAKCNANALIPLWSQLSAALSADLKLDKNTFDALQLPDVYAAERGKNRLREVLAQQLDDNKLAPGLCHDALWVSDPAAIITTNFLDTVLEKSRPRRAQPVVRDQDLGRPIIDPFRHVIYLHGHRGDPTTWVAGRQDYEQLPTNRPMIHAKVRQLLAEYPALVVGYSLNDPDFHYIYGDTLRAMGKARPRGLALSLRGVGDSASRRMKSHALNKKYWTTLGLDVVSFSKSASRTPDAAHARFFELTARIKSFSQLLTALTKPTDRIATKQAFENNATVGTSALKDEFLADDRMHPEHRSRWWREVLAHSLTPAAQTRASQAARDTNLRKHTFPLAQEAEKKPTSRHIESEPPSLDQDKWIKGPRGWRRSTTVAHLFQLLDGGNEATRQIEALLSEDTSRTHLRNWLAVALADPELVPRVIERSHVAAFALLSDGDQTRLRKAYRIARQHAEKSIIEAISPFLTQAPPRTARAERTREVRRLQQAFRLVTNGDRASAAREYESLQEHLLRVERIGGGLDKPLLTYFAAQGLLECTTLRTPLARIESLQHARDRLEQDPSVLRWRKRTRTITDGIQKAKSKNQQRLGYESHAGAWSASPGELWHHYERATILGAPLSIRRELLAPLLDTMELPGFSGQIVDLTMPQAGRYWPARS